MSKKIIRHELVEVIIPAGSSLTRFPFPDIPNLRNSHLWGLQVYPKNVIDKGIQTGIPLLDLFVVLKTSFITLCNYGGKEFLKQAPSTLFQTQFVQDISGAPPTVNQLEFTDVKSFVGQKVSWPKSYIDFTAPPGTSVTPPIDQVFMISIYYSLPIKEEEKESGFSFGRQQ